MLPWSLDDLPLFPNVDLHSLRPDSRPASYLDTTRPLFPVVDSGFGSPPVAIDTPSPHTSPPKPRNTIRRDPAYVPRPRNAFMLFRLDLNARRGSLAQKDLSRLAGAFWRRLPETKKKIYKEMANREKEIHKAKYPRYSYKYNDALSRLREPSNALNQPDNISTELTAGAAGLTDGTLPPLSFGSNYSTIPDWLLDMVDLGEGTKDLVGADVFSNLYLDLGSVDPLYTAY